MAVYYLDGSVSSSGGGGTGTRNDPFVKNQDLIQYALTMIGFTGGGQGPNGDKLININGDLPQTSSVNFGAYGTPTSAQPLVIDGTGIRGDKRTTVDLNARQWGNWTGNEYGLIFYGLDFINLPPSSAGTNACFKVLGLSAWIKCSFDNSSDLNYLGNTIIEGDFYGMIVDGCRFTMVNGRGGSNGDLIRNNSTDHFMEITNCFFDLFNGFNTYAVQAPLLSINRSVFKNMNPTRSLGSSILKMDNYLSAVNNTFYSEDQDVGIKVINGAGSGYVVNNYFEGMSTCISNESAGAMWANISGNKGFNNLQGINPASLMEGVATGNQFNLDQSGITDPMNNDFTPTEDLISAGFNTNEITFPNINAPDVGAINNQGGAPPPAESAYYPQLTGQDNSGAAPLLASYYIPRMRGF